MEQKRNTHIRKSRYSPKVTEEHTVHPEMTERQKLKKSLSETQNEKKRKTQSSEQPARPVQHQTAASRQRSRRRRRRFRLKPQFKIGGILFLVLLLVFAGGRIFLSGKQTDNKKVKAAASKDAKAAEDLVEMEVTKEISFEPHCVESTKPENLISYTNIEVDGTQLTNISDYQPESDIQFQVGEDYTDVDGIVTFRGNSFRDNPTHGYANMNDYKLNSLWSADTGSLASGNTVWTGSGWTGQPLMMKWPKEVKAHMNMTEKAKADDDLVEVIYACMDGNVYFLDLKTGEKTRDPLYLGYTFKGAGALDPRGYPIMYVGAGYNSDEGTARVFVVNLIDCSVMYTFGDNDEFSLRGSLSSSTVLHW